MVACYALFPLAVGCLLGLLFGCQVDDPRPPDTPQEWIRIFEHPLLDWTIVISDREAPTTDCTVTVHVDDRYAVLHPCPDWDQTRYSLHEVLHVVFAAVCADKEAGSDAREEQAVDAVVGAVLDGPW